MELQLLGKEKEMEQLFQKQRKVSSLETQKTEGRLGRSILSILIPAALPKQPERYVKCKFKQNVTLCKVLIAFISDDISVTLTVKSYFELDANNSTA